MKGTAYLMVAGLWVFSGLAWARFHDSEAMFSWVAKWALFLGLLCLVNFYAMAQFFFSLFSLQTIEPEKRLFTLIQTSYWGSIKLASLLILGGILWRQTHLMHLPVPDQSLVIGMGTLVIVPIFGSLVKALPEFGGV
jgi:hypothetical protein